jgi:hypothetical protein
MTATFPPAYPDSESFTTAVNAAASLPYHLEVETVLDYPDYLRVVLGKDELATMPVPEAETHGPDRAAWVLGRRARRAYATSQIRRTA